MRNIIQIIIAAAVILAGASCVTTNPYGDKAADGPNHKHGKEMVYGYEKYRSWNEIQFSGYQTAYKRAKWNLAHSWDTPAKAAMEKQVGQEITWKQWKAGKRPNPKWWHSSFKPKGTIQSCGSWGCEPVIHCNGYGCKGLK